MPLSVEKVSQVLVKAYRLTYTSKLVLIDCTSNYFVFYRPRVQTYQYQDVPGVKRHVGGNASPNASRDNGETNVNKDAEWFV